MDNQMSFTHANLKALLIIAILTLPLAYGLEDRPVYYYYTNDIGDDWPSSYYVFFGVFVAALVLFIMSVMTKPDDLP